MSAAGAPHLWADGAIITVTGQSTAVGRSTDDSNVHLGGWLRARGAGRSIVRPTIFEAYVDALTPDGAVVVFETDKPVTARVVFGKTETYEVGTATDQVGNTVRIRRLYPGELYHSASSWWTGSATK